MSFGAEIRVPGDKSITHRALMLAALARGSSRLTGLLTSLDARSSARVLRQLGAGITPLRDGAAVTVTGRPQFGEPVGTLDCGNAGTTARLLTGLLAAQRLSARLSGDASLRRRPMRRVTEPLSAMGARFAPAAADRLPFRITGGMLSPLRYDLPVASAQVKSALLLAGAAGGVEVSLLERGSPSRDHTERLLAALGFPIFHRDGRVELRGSARFRPFDLAIPGDPSSAAFLLGAILVRGRGALAIPGVCINPTRVGFLRVLERMGAALARSDETEVMGEPVATVAIRGGALTAADIAPDEVPSLVDEVPLLAVLATRARGVTRFRSVGELRVKESNRLELLAENLRAAGQEAAVEGDDLLVEGGARPPRGRIVTAGDHRIAMAFAVLGLADGARLRVDNPSCADVSFPGFAAALRRVAKAA